MKIVHYKDVPPDPVDEEGSSGLTVRWVISKKDGAPNFAMRVFKVDPGGHSPFHKHAHEHEVFILEGKGFLVQKGQELPFSKGDVIFIPPDQEHQLKNPFEEDLEFICLIPHLK